MTIDPDTPQKETQLPLPPGGMGLPLIGETLPFLTDKNFVAKRYQRYGPIFKSRILGRPTVFMVGPEAAEFVLSSHFDHFSWRDGWPQTFKALLGRSLFLQEGEEHRRNRRLMMPAFHSAALVRYMAAMENITALYLQKWESLHSFVWYDEFKQLTFDIASHLFLGTPPGQNTADLSRLFTILTGGLFGVGFRRAIAARNQLLDHLSQVIQERQANPTNDVLSLLIQAEDETGDRLSFEEIRNQAMLLLFAGHETTTAMLTWICLELARHPDCLDQARTEQTQTWDGQTPLTVELVGKMTYLDQILSEIERFHPPVAGGFRGVVKPFQFNQYQVPAGWLLQYSILHTHRTKALYPEPEQFDPERFGSNNFISKKQSFGLIGFGGGPRICLGIAFAKLEMKIVMAHLLRHYQWQLQPNQRFDPVIIPTRRPKDGLKVNFLRLQP